MLVVETIARIRREYFVKGKPIKEIVRDVKVSGNTVRKVIRSQATAFTYDRRVQPMPKLGPWTAELERMLEANETKSKRERLTLLRISEALEGLGYGGGYDAVRRYAKAWRWRRSASTAQTYVPLVFSPGEAYQFDWSHEYVVLAGVTTKVKVAHVRLCHSRMFFVRAYPRESQEMVFDAHDRAFRLFQGACRRGIYDNMKTAVQTVLIGKERAFNRRFVQMCGHYLVEPTACTPGAGWEKGQVENQVGIIRGRFFTPRLRFKTYDELNAWLLDQCVAYARRHPHPVFKDRTVWQVFEDERPSLVGYRGPFDGFHAVPASVSKTCLVRFDSNKYSVSRASAVRSRADRSFRLLAVVPGCAYMVLFLSGRWRLADGMLLGLADFVSRCGYSVEGPVIDLERFAGAVAHEHVVPVQAVEGRAQADDPAVVSDEPCRGVIALAGGVVGAEDPAGVPGLDPFGEACGGAAG